MAQQPAIPFSKKPNRAGMLAFFVKAVRERYRLKDDQKAKANAENLGLRLALSSNRGNLVVYYTIGDLSTLRSR